MVEDEQKSLCLFFPGLSHFISLIVLSCEHCSVLKNECSCAAGAAGYGNGGFYNKILDVFLMARWRTPFYLRGTLLCICICDNTKLYHSAICAIG